MHLNFLICLSLVAFTAATITGTRNIFVDEDGNYIVMVNQDGRTVQMVFETTQKGMKSVAIQVAGPMVETKAVNFSDEKVKGSEKYQTDLVKEIFQQFHGSIDIAKFQNLVQTIDKHVENGELHRNFIHALEFIQTQNVETLEGKNPLVEIPKNQQTMLTKDQREMTGMYGEKTPYYGKYVPVAYPMEGMMHHGHQMGDMQEYLLQKERQNMMDKIAMQKYKSMMQGGMMDEMDLHRQMEKEQMMRMLAEQQMHGKYDTYKRMMLGRTGMVPEDMQLEGDYDTHRYMQPGSWYKYGMMDKMDKYGQDTYDSTYDRMNRFGDNTYDNLDETQENMLRKVIYGAPQTQGMMYTHRSGLTTPYTQNMLKKQMYQTQLPMEDDVSLEEMMMQKPTKVWDTKHTGTKNSQYDMYLREKMMRMQPSMVKMTPTTYEGQMMMDETPVMGKTRYVYPRQGYSNVVY